ncbi:hypothetical protein [Acinetobacter beijerinckii]|uniref:hypothetical protein n=1 Tax=Acinetobacter beijerinckii TaxID=262668 RepID=UPI004054F07E
MSNVDSFSYFWDGSDPGWVLIRIYGQTIHLSLVFGERGPTAQEIKAVRKAVLSIRSLPAGEALSKLRGETSFDIGEFESREGRDIANICRELGLVVVEHVYDRSGYLPVNEVKNTVCLIEDNLLNKKVIEEAIRRGVPVRHQES